MRRKLSLYPNKEMSLGKKRKTTISLGESSFTQNESLQHPLEGSPPNIKGIKRCSAKKSRKDYLNTLFGITPSSYSPEHPPHYPDNSSPLPKVKLPKHRSS